MTVRVLVVDDQTMVREGLRMILDAQDDIEVVGEAGDGRAALRLVAEHRPDVVLMDIRMPVMDGIALALAAARDFAALRILLMTRYAEQRERAHGLEAVIHDVVQKPFSLADIRRAVAEALAAPSRG